MLKKNTLKCHSVKVSKEAPYLPVLFPALTETTADGADIIPEATRLIYHQEMTIKHTYISMTARSKFIKN